MAKETVTVTIDYREPDDLLPWFDSHDEVDSWQIDALDVGDILIEEANCIIERKTVPDYASSIREGHLNHQVADMTALTENAYILVEGDMEETTRLPHSSLPETAIRGHMASIMARNRVPIVPCSNQRILVDMAVRLGRKHIEGPGASFLDSGSVSKKAPTMMRMVGCIEGISTEMAQRLYEEYPTMKQLMRASPDDLKQIEGIGDRKANSIIDSLHRQEEYANG